MLYLRSRESLLGLPGFQIRSHTPISMFCLQLIIWLLLLGDCFLCSSCWIYGLWNPSSHHRSFASAQSHRAIPFFWRLCACGRCAERTATKHGKATGGVSRRWSSWTKGLGCPQNNGKQPIFICCWGSRVGLLFSPMIFLATIVASFPRQVSLAVMGPSQCFGCKVMVENRETNSDLERDNQLGGTQEPQNPWTQVELDVKLVILTKQNLIWIWYEFMLVEWWW